MNHDHGSMDHEHLMEMPDGAAKHCPMIMVFHAGNCETILFKAWTATTVPEFVLSAIAIFIISIGYEGLKYLREYLLAKGLKKEADQSEAKSKQCMDAPVEGQTCNKQQRLILKEKSYKASVTGSVHIIQSILNLIQVTVAYLLMLIAMTYNVWLFLAVMLGLGTGYFIFGCLRTNKIEHDCCG